MDDYRVEKDSLGEVKVPKDALYGAQTQRAYENFHIGIERLPPSVIIAYIKLKQACAIANHRQDILTDAQKDAIIKAGDTIIENDLAYSDHFPLSIWQSGSGTQFNMNVNEVMANLANKELDGETVHPNDHVNASQSTNDTFPTVMHITLASMIESSLEPAIEYFIDMLDETIEQIGDTVRLGRTHLQDAVPITIQQSFSAYRAFLEDANADLAIMMERLYELPIGATAVGTGINTPSGFPQDVIEHLRYSIGLPFKLADNNFAALSSHNAICHVSSILSILASNLNKIANDIRLLGSGPRGGIGELILPSNEPGSSIMPGKINPTQCEALSMACLQVMQNHQLILQCNAEGHLELNTYKPLIIKTIIDSCILLQGSLYRFGEKVILGLNINQETITQHLENSLMLITALKPIIGYDKCAKIALYAHEHGLTLKEAGLKLELITEELYDQYIKPEDMV